MIATSSFELLGTVRLLDVTVDLHRRLCSCQAVKRHSRTFGQRVQCRHGIALADPGLGPQTTRTFGGFNRLPAHDRPCCSVSPVFK
jgi:hypothetical protein